MGLVEKPAAMDFQDIVYPALKKKLGCAAGFDVPIVNPICDAQRDDRALRRSQILKGTWKASWLGKSTE